MAYSHFTMRERTLLDFFREKRFSIRCIARQLGRSPGSISRELRRNSKSGKPYRMSSAGCLARNRRSQQIRLRILRDPALQKLVDVRLKKGWSPEQISARLRLERKAVFISHGAIYRYVQWLKKQHPEKTRQFRRCPRKYRRKRGCGAFGPLGKKHVTARPQQANDRTQQGHWEIDTIMGAHGRHAVLVFVDRKTRYLIARKITSGKTREINREIIQTLMLSAKRNRKTITMDNGFEFSGYREFERVLRMPTFFCDPHSPWQRPSVENTNGLIRQLTRKKDLQAMTQKQLDYLVSLINNRPRKCLNWRTAAEEFG